FLGLRTLSVLDGAARLVERTHGVSIDLQALPMDDAAAYQVFQEAATVAIFQFESGGMRDYLKRLAPSVFEDLVAMNALYRPGPMENIPYFIDCKHGRQAARYEHPDLEPILEGTYGVFVYQEQVMQAANALAGFTLAQADELRRAMGKKRPEEMEAKRQEFTEGCRHRKIPAAKAQKIFDTMAKFAGYAFNKSHSAAYALLAYQCAWLKAHYPAEFLAATLTSEMSDSARIVTLIEECRRLQIAILPPDVNRSEWRFTIEGGAIRIGLGAIRTVGQGVVEGLVAARAEGGAFTDLLDLARRLDARGMNRRVLESLVAAGACDGLGADRGALFAAAGLVLERAASLRKERESGQSSLFAEGGGAAVAVIPSSVPAAPPWTGRERSTREKEVLGFYFSEHPLEHVRERLEHLATHRIADAVQLEDRAEVRIAGLVGEVKTIMTRAGRPMAIVTLEDLSGRVECTVFPDTLESARGLLAPETIVVASGRVEVREDRGVKLLLSEVRGLEEARQTWRRSLHIEIRVEEISEERLVGIDEVLRSHPGEAEVYLHIVRPDHSRLALRSRRFTVAEDDRVIADLKQAHPSLRVRWVKGAL
ncbi:MAG: DNA polymerase III subunit alpha, partial [Candidatus Eiseniibacteriota bacterium]